MEVRHEGGRRREFFLFLYSFVGGGFFCFLEVFSGFFFFDGGGGVGVEGCGVERREGQRRWAEEIRLAVFDSRVPLQETQKTGKTSGRPPPQKEKKKKRKE